MLLLCSCETVTNSSFRQEKLPVREALNLLIKILVNDQPKRFIILSFFAATFGLIHGLLLCFACEMTVYNSFQGKVGN